MDVPFVPMDQNYHSRFEDNTYITHPITKQQLYRLNLEMNFYRTYKHHPSGPI